MIEDKKVVQIDYTNWKGIRRMRLIQPMTLDFVATQFHPEPQWICVAIDCEDQTFKTFAMKDIHSWAPVEE